MFPLANSQRFRLCSVLVLVYICTVLCLLSIFLYLLFYFFYFIFLFLFLHLGLGHDKRRPPVRPSTALSIYLSDLIYMSPFPLLFLPPHPFSPHILQSFTNMFRPVITHFSLLDIARDIPHNSGIELNDFGFPCPRT